MNLNEMYPSRFLKAADVEQGLTLTISHVMMETMGMPGDQQEKPVVYFTDDLRGLVLNKTNAGIIGEMYGPDTDAWVGQQLQLRKDVVAFQGKMTPTVRVQFVPRIQHQTPLFGAQQGQQQGAQPAQQQAQQRPMPPQQQAPNGTANPYGHPQQPAPTPIEQAAQAPVTESATNQGDATWNFPNQPWEAQQQAQQQGAPAEQTPMQRGIDTLNRSANTPL